MDIPFAVIIPALLVAIGFVVYCLVDLTRSKHVRGLPRWAWAVVIVLFVPFGGLVYLLAGREP